MTSASTTNDVTGQTESMMQGLAAHWGLVAAMGVVSIVVGIMAIAWPGLTIVSIAILFSAWLFVSGIVSIIHSFTRDGDTGLRVLNALVGILSVIVGFALLRAPFQSVEVVIFVLGIFWVAQGIVTFIGGFSRKQGRGWALFVGAIGVIAGIIILQYPITSAVTLAFLGGIWLIILGVMQLWGAWQLRGAAKHVEAAPAAA